jgi:ACR3 family arsenite efflux pump ArsB
MILLTVSIPLLAGYIIRRFSREKKGGGKL